MFKKTNIAPFSKQVAPSSAETLYWKRFSSPILLKEVNSIECIDISPIEPNFIAVTCSSRIQLYHPITRMIHKNYNRFKEAAYGGIFRKDGKLLLAGSEECALKLFDVSSKNLLRVYKGHERAVHRCAFMPTDNQIISFSDDKTLIQWDLATEQIIHKYEGHTDYVRSGMALESNPNLIMSGSYDHTIKIWDKREKKEIISLNHEFPVEAILPSINGSLLFSAGGSEIKVWDCLTGGRLLAKISQHHKTITCLKFATDSKRLVSASLDRHIKIYDLTNFEVIHTLDYPSPILSLGIAPNDKTLIVGMSDGILSITRKEDEVKEGEEASQIEMKPKAAKKKTRHFTEFIETENGLKEENIETQPKYDKYLRKFAYSKALTSVLNYHNIIKRPGTIVAVIQELIRRDGLHQAVSGRFGNDLVKLLKFLIKHLRRPKYMRILIHVSNVVVDIYAPLIGDDPNVNELFIRLLEETTKECNYMTDLMEIQGSIEMIVSSSAKGEISTEKGISTTSLKPSEKAQETLLVSV